MKGRHGQNRAFLKHKKGRTKCANQADNLAKLWQEFFCPSYFDSTNFLRGRKTKKAIYKRKARTKPCLP